jgi:hypothetical protein
MRMTLGNSSQPRAHLNFESVFAKLAQPFVQRKTGGECEVWQRPSHAAKMQRVREALLIAQAALAGLVGPQVQPFVDANAVAAAVLPEFPAVSKKHLSLLSIDEECGDEQHEEEDEDDEADEEAVAAVESDDDEDSACDVNSVAASAIHDDDEDTNKNEPAQEAPPEGQADEVREVQQPPAVNVGAAEAVEVVAAAAESFLLHSPQYSPLWSPIRSDALDATGLGLTPLECATVNGGLSGSLSPWSGVVSSVAAGGIDGAEHGIHDFAMPLLDVDAAWHHWMRTE